MASCMYSFLRGLFRLILNIFFRDISVIGSHHIPKDGAVIFCGNHQNQFVDPLMILTNCPRDIGFLIAEKSIKRPVIGWFARQMRSIPVRRAQDGVSNGSGKVVWRENDSVIQGVGTAFDKEVVVGDKINVVGFEEATVQEVLSSTQLKVAAPLALACPTEHAFKIAKKIDQSAVYEYVWETLKEGNCIGIFPEGGSHDRPTLLPIKAGVALMALGAMQKHKIKVYVVPCGLNYFQGHKFRSQVHVEFGRPYEVPTELAEKYATNRRDAIGELLKEIEMRMFDVTINADDYDSLRLVHTARRLYKPKDVALTPEQNLALSRRFAVGYNKFKEQPRFQEMAERLLTYLDQLDALGIKDKQVAALDSPVCRALGLLLWRIVFLVFFFLLSIPGLILTLPIGVICRVLAEKERKKALASSTVKIHATDVMASYKILVSLVLAPLVNIIYAVLSFLLVNYLWPNCGFWLWLVPLITFFGMPIVSYISVRVLEKSLFMFRSLPRLWLCICGGEKKEYLRSTRIALSQNIRRLVEEFGPQVFEDFWNNRIVNSEQLKQEHQRWNNIKGLTDKQLGAFDIEPLGD